jgi:hypothetical protein
MLLTRRHHHRPFGRERSRCHQPDAARQTVDPFAGSMDGRGARRNLFQTLLEKLSKKGRAADIEDTRDTGDSKEPAAQLFSKPQKRWLFLPAKGQPDTGRIHCFIFERIAVTGARTPNKFSAGRKIGCGRPRRQSPRRNCGGLHRCCAGIFRRGRPDRSGGDRSGGRIHEAG